MKRFCWSFLSNWKFLGREESRYARLGMSSTITNQFGYVENSFGISNTTKVVSRDLCRARTFEPASVPNSGRGFAASAFPVSFCPAGDNSRHSPCVFNRVTKPDFFDSRSVVKSLPATPPSQTRGFATRRAAQSATHSNKFSGGKIKPYTSLKRRFKVLKKRMEVKRWKMGYGHKRSTKSKAQRQRLRTPTTVYKAYARVMKKLGMKGF
mmetsp:Transcript_2472/g.5869  ORF Transcript_2472/g.5869 Transcript_2472/m.5869 type:complete len:209 (+) Transcript_2472:80-706(+)